MALSMRSQAVSTALAAILTVVPYASAQLSDTGNITLFSDTNCAEAAFANSWTLGRDFCGSVESSSSRPTDVTFQSYILNERPWCTNGSRPYFNVYSDEACSNLIHSYEPGPLYHPIGPDADGTCVVPGGGYKAMAFICDGFPGAWGKEGAEPTSSVGPSSSAGPESASPLITDSPTSTTSGAALGSSTVAVTSAVVSSSKISESAPIASSTSNGTATTSNLASSIPTQVFDGSGSSLWAYQSSPIALFLFALGLLA